MSRQLYPGCYAISNQNAHCTRSQIQTQVSFLTSPYLHYEASVAGSIYSTHQQSSSKIKSPFLPYRSPQHLFPVLQHKLICKRSLTSLCGRPILSSAQYIGQFCSLGPPHDCQASEKSSIFCTASSPLQLDDVQDTHVWLFAVAGIGGFKNGAQRNVKVDLL